MDILCLVDKLNVMLWLSLTGRPSRMVTETGSLFLINKSSGQKRIQLKLMSRELLEFKEFWVKKRKEETDLKNLVYSMSFRAL
jgi:hypothetical protein